MQNQISAIFQIFQNFPYFSCPWARPEPRSIFSPEIFQKLILAESESTYPTVGLDKRKLQINNRLSSTEPNREQNEPKKSGPNSANLAPHHRLILFYKPILRNCLYKPFELGMIFATTISGNFPAQNLKLHVNMSDWTKEKRKRTTQY